MWAHKYTFPQIYMAMKAPREITSVDPEVLDDNEIMAAGDKMKEIPGLTVKQALLMTAADIPTVALDDAQVRKFSKRYLDLTGTDLAKAA